MEIKIKNTPLYKTSGVMWSIIAIVNIGLLIFTLKDLGGFGLMVSPLIGFTVILNIIAAVFYLRIHKINYITIDDNQLLKFRSVVVPRKKVDLNMVEKVAILGDRLILALKDGKDVEINLKMISLKDYEKLKERLNID